jgi:hypothetical protein
MHHRTYHPRLGHFLTPDFRPPSIDDPSTFTEPYAYAAGNPGMYWDLNGLETASQQMLNKAVDLHVAGGFWNNLGAGALFVGAVVEEFFAGSVGRVADSLITGDTEAGVADYRFAALEIIPVVSQVKHLKNVRQLKRLQHLEKSAEGAQKALSTADEVGEIIETVLNPKTGVYEPLLKPSVSSKLPAIVPKTSSLPVVLENFSALPAIIPGTPSELLRYEGSINAARAIGAKLINVGVSKSLVRPVKGRSPINSQKYAGRTVPLGALSLELRAKYPHSVHFSETGFPDFSRYSIKNVRIELGKSRGVDFGRADRAAGFSRSNPRPEGYTWHHHQDSGYMQLVPTDLHDWIKHTGGVATKP